MKAARVNPDEYLKTLEARGAPHRVTRSFQLIGLEIATILRDLEHRSLYIKLSKELDPSVLLNLAKQVAERRGVKNRGAYFMSLLEDVRRAAPRTRRA